MTDPDLTAIATYLKDLPQQTASPPAAVSASDPTIVARGAIYADECSACHGMDGKGVPNLFPSLAGSSNVRSTDPASLIRIVLESAQRCNRRRANQPGNAVVRMEAERRSTRHGPHLYPQLLGFGGTSGRRPRDQSGSRIAGARGAIGKKCGQGPKTAFAPNCVDSALNVRLGSSGPKTRPQSGRFQVGKVCLQLMSQNNGHHSRKCYSRHSCVPI
jgi:hypothetical protein